MTVTQQQSCLRMVNLQTRMMLYILEILHTSQALSVIWEIILTGDGDGDDEQILIELSRVPQEYDKIVIVVNIYSAVQRKQHFGMIRNAFIRIVDGSTNKEMCKYDLTENYSGMTAMIFGEIYRHNGEWKFGAIGQGTKDTSIGDLCRRYV